MTTDRRDFLKSSATIAAGAAAGSCASSAKEGRPHRWIDREKCIACGQCVTVCPMGAITLREKSEVDPDECAECGTCWRSRVCPVDAIMNGELTYPRVLRAVFSDPLAEHEDTGVRGRGTEGIKTNDAIERFGRGKMGVFVELGRPALGARLRDAELVVKKFKSRGYDVIKENPVHGLIADHNTGDMKPEVLDQKVISCLVEFVLPESAAADLLAMAEELSNEVESVFNLSVALRARPDGSSPLYELFPSDTFSLPNGKVNIGLSEGIAG